MKKFFSNSLNVILTVSLLTVFFIIGFLAYNLLGLGHKDIIVPDFSGKTESDVQTWIYENKISEDKYTFEYEYDEVIPEYYLIYQSVKANDKLKDTISFVFSKGGVPDFNTMNEEEIRKWAQDNDVVLNIDYVYSDTVEKGKVVSQTAVGSEIVKGGIIDVVLSNGPASQADTVIVPDGYIGYTEQDFVKTIQELGLKAVKQDKTYENKSMKDGSVYSYDSTSDGVVFHKGDTVKYYLVKNPDNTVNVPDNFIGLKEADFISKIEALGLKASKQTTTYKSSKYQTGTVYAYDSTSDGIVFKKGDTVKYYLVDNGDGTSDVVVVPDNYIGYTEANFIKAIEALGLKTSKQSKTYKSQKYQTGQVYAYDSTSDGIVFKKGDTVKYYLVDNGDGGSQTSDEVVVPDTYLGYTEANFIKAIEALGLKTSKQSKTYTSQKYQTGTVYIYDSTSDGIKFKKGDTVKYYLVDNGDSNPNPNPNPNPDPTPTVETVTLDNLVGMSEAAAKQNLTNKGLNYTTSSAYSSTVEEGKVISMSPAAGTKVDKGSSVALTISLGVQKASLLAPNFLINNYSASTYQDAVNSLTAYFNGQGFTNVTYQGVSSTKSIGQIVSISVNGDTAYTAGDYPINTPIVVQIVNQILN